MESSIKYCKNCSKRQINHEYQDEKYGKFHRLMNPTGKGGSSDGLKCTVCGEKYKNK